MTGASGAPPRAVPENTGARSRAGSFLELTKPRITALVVISAATGHLVAADGRPSLLTFLALLAGTALSAGGTNALNQWWERDLDARMERTRDRPLPAGRLSPAPALIFGLGLAVVGVGLLAAGTTLTTAGLAAATVVLYVTVYTPLKQKSVLCTYVGALPGALPVLGGWAAAGEGLAGTGWALFGLLGLWQLPHFFALEWMARRDYREAGFATLAVRDPSGRRSGRHALACTLVLLPVSLLALAHPALDVLYGTAAVVGGGLLLIPAGGFRLEPSRRWARRLFSASLCYLPLMLMAAIGEAWIRGG